LGILIQLAVALFLGMSAIECLAGFVQVFIAVIILCGIGNGISIMMPFRVNVGSLKPTKVPVKNVLMIMVITLMMPIFLLPALLGPIAGLLLGISGVVTGAVGNLMVSGALLLAVAVVYCLTLKPLGRLLAERELRILDTVTVEVE
ncbi:MAG TPA: hypothetical protein DCY13_09240, partial [Verrucomicrobiales bacterium]|nr:hypothetical protein [Verrucomicrobiales bacterium]